MEAILIPDKNFPEITINAQNYIIQNINSMNLFSWSTLEKLLKETKFIKVLEELFSTFAEWHDCWIELGGCTRRHLAE